MKRAFLAAPLLLLPAASALPLQPGKWQSTVTILAMQMPNAPPVATAMARRPTTVTACITAAQAADGPRALLSGSNGRCHFTSYEMSGGRFHSVMQCAIGTGTMTQTQNGTYGATSLDVNGTSVTTGRMSMTMKTHTVGRRLGGC
jgi:hypothetical protein